VCIGTVLWVLSKRFSREEQFKTVHSHSRDVSRYSSSKNFRLTSCHNIPSRWLTWWPQVAMQLFWLRWSAAYTERKVMTIKPKQKIYSGIHMGPPGMGKGGVLAPCKYCNCKSVVTAAKLLVDELFMHYFHNLLSAYGALPPDHHWGSIHGPCWGTFVPRPLICPLEKILRAAMSSHVCECSAINDECSDYCTLMTGH